MAILCPKRSHFISNISTKISGMLGITTHTVINNSQSKTCNKIIRVKMFHLKKQ